MDATASRFPRHIGVRLIAALALTAASTCATVKPPPPNLVLPLRTYTLPTGLRVVIEEDDSAKVTGLVWVVDAGSADDPADKPDLAHAVEHTVLRARDERGTSLMQRLARLGGIGVNAGTGLEQTTYQAFVPRSALDEALAAQATRFADPLRGVDEALFAAERSVVDEEHDLSDDLTKRIGFDLALAALFSPAVPYARRGSEVRLARSQLALADLRAFTERAYRPEMMTLVVSGAVKPDWDRQLQAILQRAWPGQSDAGGAPPPVQAVRRPVATTAASVKSPSAIEHRGAAVAETELWMAWVLPPARGPGRIPLGMLGHVVDRVLQGAIGDERLPGVTAVDADVMTGALASALFCRIVLRPGADPGRARSEVDRFVASLADLENGYPRRFVARIIRDAAIGSSLGADDLIARSLYRANLVHQDPDATIGGTVAAIRRVGITELVALASAHLTAGASRAVLLSPNEKGEGRSWAMSRSDVDHLAGARPLIASEEAGDDRDDDAPSDQTADASKIAQAPGASAASVTHLANGLTLIVLPRPGLPFATVLLGFHGEPRRDEPLGVRWAVRPGLWHRLEEGHAGALGLLHAVRQDADSYWEEVSLFADGTDRAFSFFDDETDSMLVRWPGPLAESRWARWKAHQATPAAQSDRAFTRSLWGGHVYGQDPLVEDLRKVTSDDVERWLERVRRPRNGVVIVVGDVDGATVGRQLEDRLGGWKGSAAAVELPPIPPAVTPWAADGLKISFTADKDRHTAGVRFGCLLPSVHTRRDSAVHGFLASLMGDALFHDLRTSRGASYVTSVHASYARGGAAWLEGVLDVRSDALGSAVRLLRAWLATDGQVVFDQDAVERERRRLARSSNLWFSTNKALARGIFDAWNMGWSPAVLDDYPAALASITVADLNNALDACRAHGVISVIGREPVPAVAAPAPKP